MAVIAIVVSLWFVCGFLSAAWLAAWHRHQFGKPIDASWFALAILMGFPGLIATWVLVLTE